MSVFDAAATAIAADPNMGVAALYTATGEPPLAIRVVMSREEAPTLATGRGMVSAGYEVMIPASAIPDRVQRGELLSIGTLDFTVETAELDETGASWRVQLRSAR